MIYYKETAFLLLLGLVLVSVRELCESLESVSPGGLNSLVLL
jgi:hypothetical protein